MDVEIGLNFLFYNTAHEIWMGAQETYSDNENTTELFERERWLSHVGLVPPKQNDKIFKTWKTENNMVMSWLINTTDAKIGQNFLFYNTAHKI